MVRARCCAPGWSGFTSCGVDRTKSSERWPWWCFAVLKKKGAPSPRAALLPPAGIEQTAQWPAEAERRPPEVCHLGGLELSAEPWVRAGDIKVWQPPLLTLRSHRSEGGGRCIRRNCDTMMPWEGRAGPCGALHESTAQPRAVPSLGGRADPLRVLRSGWTQSSGPTGLSADQAQWAPRDPHPRHFRSPACPHPGEDHPSHTPALARTVPYSLARAGLLFALNPGQPQELGHLHLGSWQLRLAPALSCSSWCGPGAVAPWELVLEKQEFGRCPRQTGWASVLVKTLASPRGMVIAVWEAGLSLASWFQEPVRRLPDKSSLLMDF